MNDDIKEGYKDGKAITGIRYSTGLKQSFVVMTETLGKQSCKWFNMTTKGKQGTEKIGLTRSTKKGYILLSFSKIQQTSNRDDRR